MLVVGTISKGSLVCVPPPPLRLMLLCSCLVQGTLVAMMDQGLVAGFKEYHTVTDVEFLVKLTPEGVNMVKETEPESMFKLRRQMSLANMCVWGGWVGVWVWVWGGCGVVV